MAIANVHVKQIQSVMRHSAITLTMDTYGHLLPDATAEAVIQQGIVFQKRDG
jgi:integrase